MNWELFFAFMAIGLAIIALQWMTAYGDDWLFKSQVKKQGREGYALIEHGGMWIDVCLLSWFIPWIASKYSLHYFSSGGIIALVCIAIGILIAGTIYSEQSMENPEAYAYEKKTSAAGWLHGLFALGAAWILVRFYVGTPTPRVSTHDYVLVSTVLSLFLFPMGIIKLSRKWRWRKQQTIQLAVAVIILWIVTLCRIL